MELRISLSGSDIYVGEIDFVPPIGSEIVLETQQYKSGLRPGSIIKIRVGSHEPPGLDLTGRKPVVRVDANGYEVFREGPPLDGDE